jgi:hypothetical protein
MSNRARERFPAVLRVIKIKGHLNHLINNMIDDPDPAMDKVKRPLHENIHKPHGLFTATRHTFARRMVTNGANRVSVIFQMDTFTH